MNLDFITQAEKEDALKIPRIEPENALRPCEENLPEDLAPEDRLFKEETSDRWPSNKVRKHFYFWNFLVKYEPQIPYVIAERSNYTEEERMVIAQAIANIEASSCVEFVERNEETDFDFLEISSDRLGCFVFPAGYRMGFGKHVMNLQREIDGRTCMVIKEKSF